MTVSQPDLRRHPHADHYVTVEVGHIGASAAVTCSGTEGAFCRLSCPHGCEAWSDDLASPCGPEEAPHVLIGQDYCCVVESLEAVGVLDAHTGPEQAVPGPRALIVAEWDEGYLWRFVEADT